MEKLELTSEQGYKLLNCVNIYDNSEDIINAWERAGYIKKTNQMRFHEKVLKFTALCKADADNILIMEKFKEIIFLHDKICIEYETKINQPKEK